MKSQADEPTSGAGAPIADRWIARADEGSPEARAGTPEARSLQEARPRAAFHQAAAFPPEEVPSHHLEGVPSLPEPARARP